MRWQTFNTKGRGDICEKFCASPKQTVHLLECSVLPVKVQVCIGGFRVNR